MAQTRVVNHSHEVIAPDFNPNKSADRKELNAISRNPDAAAAFADVGKAISEASTAPNNTNGGTHFMLDFGPGTPQPEWYTGGSIENSYGPFTNTAGGDVPRGEEVDIEIVNYPPQK